MNGTTESRELGETLDLRAHPLTKDGHEFEPGDEVLIHDRFHGDIWVSIEAYARKSGYYIGHAVRSPAIRSRYSLGGRLNFPERAVLSARVQGTRKSRD